MCGEINDTLSDVRTLGKRFFLFFIEDIKLKGTDTKAAGLLTSDIKENRISKVRKLFEVNKSTCMKS